MNPRHRLSIFALIVAVIPALYAQDVAPITKEFSFELKKGTPPMLATLLWKGSSLRGIEVRSKPGGSVAQRIKIGEGEIVGCDLDQEDLPPSDWIGTIDFNGDGFQDIYLQVAQGSSRPYAILLYDVKSKRFIASKALAAVTGLDVSTGESAAAAQTSTRKLADSFGLVLKDTMKPARISISGPPLKKGDYVTVVRLSEEEMTYDAEIDETVASTEDESGTTTYTLKCTPDPADEEVFVGTGVIGPIHGIVRDKANVPSTRVADAPRGERLYFRTCTSGEGMHLTVWSGKPLVGKRIWHRYHHLGYDVEPSCKPEDYEE